MLFTLAVRASSFMSTTIYFKENVMITKKLTFFFSKLFFGTSSMVLLNSMIKIITF